MRKSSAKHLRHELRRPAQHDQSLAWSKTVAGEIGCDFLPASADVLAGPTPISDVPHQAPGQGAGPGEPRRRTVEAPPPAADPRAVANRAWGAVDVLHAAVYD